MRKNRTLLLRPVLFALCVVILSVDAAAQDDSAPPPSRTVSREERNRLYQPSDVKTHTKLALEMMSNRLVAAERFSSQSEFDLAYRELGGFEGLLNDTLEYLIRTSDESGRSMDNFKRFELNIRTFSPRIEAIRRDLPSRYDDYVRSLLKCVRDARARAVEPLFGDTVVKVKAGI